MKNIALNDLRDLADQLGVRTMKSNDGRVLIVSQPADEDFPHDVYVTFCAENNKIQYRGYAKGFDAPRERRSEALAFCNEWNRENCFPKAYVDSDGDFQTELTFFTDVDLEPEYVKENFFRAGLAFGWQFFIEAGKRFE